MKSIPQSLKITAFSLLAACGLMAQPTLPNPASYNVTTDTNIVLLDQFTNIFNANTELMSIAIDTNLVTARSDIGSSPTLSDLWLYTVDYSSLTPYRVRSDRIGGGGGGDWDNQATNVGRGLIVTNNLLITSGSLGVGTNSPQESLHVFGDVRMDQGQLALFPTNTSDIDTLTIKSLDGTEARVQLGLFADDGVLSMYDDSGVLGFQFLAGADNLNYMAGSLGVGVVSPYESLHVSSNAIIQGSNIVNTMRVTNGLSLDHVTASRMAWFNSEGQLTNTSFNVGNLAQWSGADSNNFLTVQTGLNDLNDVSINSPQAGQLLTYDGSLYTNSNMRLFAGTGSPEGSVTAPVGSLYIRTDGAADSVAYWKTNGSGNTGWGAALMAPDDTGAGGGDSVTVNGTAVTDPDFTNETAILPANALGVAWHTSGNDIVGSIAYNTSQFQASGTNAANTNTLKLADNVVMSNAFVQGDLSVTGAVYNYGTGGSLLQLFATNGSTYSALAAQKDQTSNTVHYLPTNSLPGLLLTSKVDDETNQIQATSTSAGVAGAISDETGSGAMVFASSPTITTPTIASFANAGHDHADAAGGGTLAGEVIASGTVADARIASTIARDTEVAAATNELDAAKLYGDIAVARMGSGTPDGTKFLRDDKTWVTPSGSGGPSTSNNIPTSAVTVFGTAPATNVMFDADAATVFRFTMTNQAGLWITNGSDGQTITLQLMQDSTGARTAVPVHNTGGTETNLWRFGTTVPDITLTTNALKTDYVKLQYWAASNYWDVIGFVQGY